MKPDATVPNPADATSDPPDEVAGANLAVVEPGRGCVQREVVVERGTDQAS